jgi:phytol kinase
MNPFLGITLVLTALGILIGTVKLAGRSGKLSPEWSRKLVHMGMGFVTLAFPWVFNAAWPVFLLCGLAVGSLAAVRWWSPAKAVGGGVLDGVKRRSFGEFYFPISVSIIFALTLGSPVRYAIPVLVLTLADAVAALVGTRYGQSPYTTKEGRKSWEGSLAFFLVGFFSVHVPLLLFTDIGRAESLLVAMTLALVVMLFEAIAWEGLDNLFIPLGTHFLLGLYLVMDVQALVARFLVTFGLVVFTLAWRKRTTLDDAGLLGAALAGYAFYALGGWAWLLPPLAFFLLFPVLNPGSHGVHHHDINAVLGTAGPGVLWLILHRLDVRGAHFVPFAACYTAHLVIVAFTHRAWKHPDRGLPGLFGLSLLLGWLGLGTVVLIRDLAMRTPLAALLAGQGALLVGAALGAFAFAAWQPGLRDCPADGARWARQGLCGVLGSAAAYLGAVRWL